MGFGEQLTAYTRLMRVTKRFVASLIGESEQTLGNWSRGINFSGAQLDTLADATGATADWWLGRKVVTMWGYDILMMQADLADIAAGIEAVDLVDRSVKVIDEVKRLCSRCRDDWFMAGVLGLRVPDYLRLVAERDDLSAVTLGRLVDFTLLHEDWLMDGDLSALRRRHNLGKYQVLARRFEEDGLLPDEIESNYPSLRRRIYQQRTMLKMPHENE